MPLILEDGTGLSNSNSYASLAEANLYFDSHPYYSDAWAGLGENDREAALIRASLQLDSLITWYGVIANLSQAMDWPRIGVYDDEGRAIPSNIVPNQVKYATMEMAYYLSKGDPFAPSGGQGLDELKIDVIELKFASSTTPVPVPPAALTWLKGLGYTSYGRRVSKVLVG